MARKIVLPPPSNRRQPLMNNQASQPSKPRKIFAEVAGGTTAECAAVFCCCPCTVMNLVVLAVYKVPAGLCRKAMNKMKRHCKKENKKKKKKGLLPQQRRGSNCGCVETTGTPVHPLSVECCSAHKLEKSECSVKDALDLENEMLEKFGNSGFWRSPSQRDR